MRLRILPLLFGAVLLVAGEDPFEAPPELQAFARMHTINQVGVSDKLGALIRSFFASPEEGGLGITYDNAYTRTLPEAWRDRKANCLTLTMLYVAACNSVGLDARYAESLRINRWRRVGSMVRYERHIVAVIPRGGVTRDLVADFLPEVRREPMLVALLDRNRVKAFFLSNRAAELLEGSRAGEALELAQLSIQADPTSSAGWNILGVVQRDLGLEAEAEVSFHKALAANPKDGAPCGNLEDLLRSQGRQQEAQVYREKGFEVRKRDPFFNAFLAEEALLEGRWDEADKRIRQAISLQPHEPEFYLIQARLALAQGFRADAIKALEKARKWAMPEMQARYDSKLALLKGEKPT